MYDVNNCFTHDGAGGLVQALTGDAASTNYIDLDAAGLNIAGGKPIYLVCRVVSAFVTLTTLEILLENDEDSGFATSLIQVLMWRYTLAQLTAGALIINQALPVVKYKQYMRLYFNVVGSDPGSGSSLIAGLVRGPEPAVDAIDQVNSGA
jgi:hypothetical protein